MMSIGEWDAEMVDGIILMSGGFLDNAGDARDIASRLLHIDVNADNANRVVRMMGYNRDYYALSPKFRREGNKLMNWKHAHNGDCFYPNSDIVADDGNDHPNLPASMLRKLNVNENEESRIPAKDLPRFVIACILLVMALVFGVIGVNMSSVPMFTAFGVLAFIAVTLISTVSVNNDYRSKKSKKRNKKSEFYLLSKGDRGAFVDYLNNHGYGNKIWKVKKTDGSIATVAVVKDSMTSIIRKMVNDSVIVEGIYANDTHDDDIRSLLGHVHELDTINTFNNKDNTKRLKDVNVTRHARGVLIDRTQANINAASRTMNEALSKLKAAEVTSLNSSTIYDAASKKAQVALKALDIGDNSAYKDTLININKIIELLDKMHGDNPIQESIDDLQAVLEEKSRI